MNLINQEVYNGERCLFKSDDLQLKNCVFEDGESPLKESSNLDIAHTTFNSKYPLWYCHKVKVNDCSFTEGARAGLWYVNHLEMNNSLISAVKNLRKVNHATLKDVYLSDAFETLWHCNDIIIDHIQAKGDNFALDCHNLKIDYLTLDGKYCFDSCSNLEIHNSRFIGRDCFWNCENVAVYDSTITGEYFGWNSKHLTLVNCTIESLQGLCYVEDLKMVNCKLVNTNLAFEYCKDIDAKIDSTILSIKNPISGRIECLGVDELILDDDSINHDDTKIITFCGWENPSL